MKAASSAGASGPILLILAGGNCDRAIGAAFERAKSTSKPLRAIQILTSDLYHYGHHDLVATRHSKRAFLLHIREEVLERGRAQARLLEEKARQAKVSIEISAVESEDVPSASLEEAKKGCGIIFLPRQKKRLFPLFKPSLESYLKKRIQAEIVVC